MLYSRDNLGRIIKKTETVNSVTSTYGYTYDVEGRLIQVKKDGAVISGYSYDYDVLGSLVSVTLPDSTQIDYLIDGVGRRVGKLVGGVLEQGFLYKTTKSWPNWTELTSS